METKIISFRLPDTTSYPPRHNTFGWVAIVDDIEVGWVNMTLLPRKVIKFEDAYVLAQHREKGLYKKLWETRWDYINIHYIGYKVVAYCKESTVDYYRKKGFEIKSITSLVEIQL
jgi:predicted GNAT family acetyltransferase